MKKLFVMLALFISVKSFCQETPIQRITAQFLKVIESKSETEGRKFIEANYSDIFLKKVPMNIHMKVMKDLQDGYSKNTVTNKIFTTTKVVLVIHSLINNKTKQVTMETDPHDVNKIFIIDVRDAVN